MNVAASENLKVWGKMLTLFCEEMKKGYLAAQFQIAFNCVNHFFFFGRNDHFLYHKHTKVSFKFDIL